eukprot:CAMPEP_0206196052 /NCGR_PEP_ID=MMETSP0166-20121206/8213_1 /ASSEMBLY_ACC=CAM_ASM_000260 /TAXON_ID=95228 /ORGANISM="Vannella robusta, Strain DIVA3 518/3/11/1/6" /LENGTH=82 /DNA_ID=CAMNT_0053613443 /DNA_START=550 /DNA_END=795 /DNA_ORIENTATION=-
MAKTTISEEETTLCNLFNRYLKDSNADSLLTFYENNFDIDASQIQTTLMFLKYLTYHHNLTTMFQMEEANPSIKSSNYRTMS